MKISFARANWNYPRYPCLCVFRSAVRRPGSIAARGGIAALNINKEELEKSVINKKDYLQPSAPSKEKTANEVDNHWNVRNESLRSVPNYYPLEKSHRYVSDSSANEIATRISESCRMMSVQAMYDSDLVSQGFILPISSKSSADQAHEYFLKLLQYEGNCFVENIRTC